MHWLAFDIGGANLKAADGLGYAATQYFPLWQKPRQLTDTLRSMIQAAPASDHIAATMTGELSDCFSTRNEGVQFILSALSTAAEQRHIRVYQTTGQLVAPQLALRSPMQVAAGNWHALAKFCGRYAPQGLGIMIDIGTTTTDIIPLLNGQVAAQGKNDVERLQYGELVYCGVERTPLCGLAGNLPYRDNWISCANEFFATTRDVYLTLDELEAAPNDLNTANGKPATKSYSRDRLAHMVCCDRDSFDEQDALAIAQAVDRQMLAKIGSALGLVTGRFEDQVATLIISGQGEFLIRRLLDRLRLKCQLVSLAETLGPLVSRCAPAHALAVLARAG
jgi:(4-(4-[2-(gamma-L-glutamylamino)ethyl]phenoxymethyl)furan-2-yl)methanamine synthase